MFGWLKPKQDKTGVVFTREQMARIFKNAFGKDCLVLCDDAAYFAITTSEFMRLARQRQPEPNYVRELYDCNRFSAGFYADVSRIWANKTWGNFPLAFGRVKVKQKDKPNHALIVQVDTRGLIHFIEPQMDMEIDSKELIPYFVEA